MSSAKRLFLISVGAAAGVTATLLLAGAAFYKLASHETPWNTSAVVAVFDKLDDAASEQDGRYHGRPRFRYVLQNATRFDISLTSFRLAAKLRRQNGILMDDSQKHLSLGTPLFIPAGSRAVISVQLKGYSSDSPLTAEDRREVRDRLLSDFIGDVADLDGFVIFDDQRRLRIDLPRGW